MRENHDDQGGHTNGDGIDESALLAAEIRAKDNPDEVVQRVLGRIDQQKGATRKWAIKLLLGIAVQLDDRPETIERLIDASDVAFKGMALRVASTLFHEGKKDLALGQFDRAFATMDLQHVCVDEAYKGVRIAHVLGKKEQMEMFLARLLELAKHDDEAISRGIGLAHDLFRDGHHDAAELVCQRLDAARPGANVRQKYDKLELVFASKSDRKDFPSLVTAPDKLVDFCTADLKLDSSEANLSVYMNQAHILAKGYDDALTANRLWQVILARAPHHASAFLHFSRMANVLGTSKEVDALIRHAHALHAEQKQLGWKRGAKARKRQTEDDDHSVRVGVGVAIGDATRPAQGWLTRAEQLALSGDIDGAFAIWIALLQQHAMLMPNVVRAFERLLGSLPLDSLFSAARMQQILQSVPEGPKIYHSLAARIADTDPAFAEHILRSLMAMRPKEIGDRYNLSNVLIRSGKFAEVIRLWLPLEPRNAGACADVASSLVKVGQSQLATMLFAAVAKISPETCIKHGYEFFRNADRSADVLACIRPLLPTGDEAVLAEHQLFALKLLVRHSPNPAIPHNIVDRLFTKGALDRPTAERILGTRIVSREERVRQERDAEIEAYLQKRMPGLRGSKFFSELSDRQPHLRPGKRTNRTASAVLMSPHDSSHHQQMHGRKPRRNR